MDSSVSPKDEIWSLRVCHHISNAVYHTNSTTFRGAGSEVQDSVHATRYDFDTIHMFIFYNL